MPINYAHKVIFIHIPKCAGSTVEDILKTDIIETYYSIHKAKNTGIIVERNKFNNIFDYNNCVCKTPQHFTYRELKRSLPKSIFANYYKFTIVRNPYSRIVSDYHFVINYYKDLQNYTFEQFLEKLTLPQFERINYFDGHLEPQYTYLIDDDNSIKDMQIFNYENLNECFIYLKNLTGVAEIPHLRKTTYSKPYQEYFTSFTQEKVYNFYKEDFLRFNYKFNI